MFRLICVAGSALLSVACLPDDTRDPPGQLVITATSATASSGGGVLTQDGWRVRVSRFLVVLGRVELQGDRCDAYSEGGYSRILDAMEPGAQKVATLFGLGECDVGFAIEPPAWDTIPGIGIDQTEERLIRTPEPGEIPALGVSVSVEGSASRGDDSLSFAWSFRQFIRYGACERADATPPRGVHLEAEQRVEIDIGLDASGLFAQRGEGLAFEPFRAADVEHGNGDGFISLDELGAAPPPGMLESNGSAPSLRDHVEVEVLPQIARYRGTGTCRVSSQAEEPDTDGF